MINNEEAESFRHEAEELRKKLKAKGDLGEDEIKRQVDNFLYGRIKGIEPQPEPEKPIAYEQLSIAQVGKILTDAYETQNFQVGFASEDPKSIRAFVENLGTIAGSGVTHVGISSLTAIQAVFLNDVVSTNLEAAKAKNHRSISRYTVIPDKLMGRLGESGGLLKDLITYCQENGVKVIGLEPEEAKNNFHIAQLTADHVLDDYRDPVAANRPNREIVFLTDLCVSKEPLIALLPDEMTTYKTNITFENLTQPSIDAKLAEGRIKV